MQNGVAATGAVSDITLCIELKLWIEGRG